MAYNPNDPRLRVNKTSALTLSTLWQKVEFDGTSTWNVNTFGKDPASGNPMVMWDSTSKLFKFAGNSDMNLQVFLFTKTTATLITTRATLQYRFVIPNGGGAGVNSYFPFPEEGGYADLAEITIISTAQNNRIEPIPLYVNQALRTNGCWLEVRLSNSLVTLGVATLNSCNLLFQSIGK